MLRVSKSQHQVATMTEKTNSNLLQVTRVYYPGLVSHPEHYIAKQQMTGFGGVVSFEVRHDQDLFVLLSAGAFWFCLYEFLKSFLVLTHVD